MADKNFKKIFNEIAVSHSFKPCCGGWFKESSESIVALFLQKSNFGSNYYLNIKVFFQGSFGIYYQKTKDLKFATSDILRRQPNEYNDVFDLEVPLDDAYRTKKIQDLFVDFVVPFTNKSLSRKQILELEKNNELILLASVKEELKKLENG
jgi:hypothetical protein